jgi:ribosomal-protein-alanine N-acetyltransferase
MTAYTRLIEPRDLPAVLEIERMAFDIPWSEQEFRRVLSMGNCFGVALLERGTIVGYVIYETHPNRIHVLNLAIAPLHRRLCLGSMLINEIKSLLTTKRRRILLEVRETNLAAQLFFKSLGFRALAVRKDFYDDTTEDAYVMQYRVRAETSV